MRVARGEEGIGGCCRFNFIVVGKKEHGVDKVQYRRQKITFKNSLQLAELCRSWITQAGTQQVPVGKKCLYQSRYFQKNPKINLCSYTRNSFHFRHRLKIAVCPRLHLARIKTAQLLHRGTEIVCKDTQRQTISNQHFSPELNTKLL